MDIVFAKEKLKKIFNKETLLIKTYGIENGRIIKRRLSVLRAAPNLSHVSHRPPERRHELIGKRKGEYAVDLKHPFRLIFLPNYNPIPLKEDGSFDLEKIISIIIKSVEDYH